jgi:hypothetical protein
MTDPEVVKLLRWLADEIDNGRAQPKMVEVNFDDDVEVEPRSWRDSPAEPPQAPPGFKRSLVRDPDRSPAPHVVNDDP